MIYTSLTDRMGRGYAERVPTDRTPSTEDVRAAAANFNLSAASLERFCGLSPDAARAVVAERDGTASAPALSREDSAREATHACIRGMAPVALKPFAEALIQADPDFTVESARAALQAEHAKDKTARVTQETFSRSLRAIGSSEDVAPCAVTAQDLERVSKSIGRAFGK